MKIPISISPAFWLVAALIGYLSSFSFLGTLVWVVVIFVSVFVHEMGHALTAKAFGLKPRIAFVAMGGLTYHHGQSLPFWKQFLIVLNGPLFGLGLFFLASFILDFSSLQEGLLRSTILLFRGVNLFWTLVNLLPILPLDGGHLLRIVLEGAFGPKGVRYAFLASAILSVAGSLFFFVYGSILIGALFFLFAFQSFETWRQMRYFSKEDQSERYKRDFIRAEELFRQGDKQNALAAFYELQKQAGHGIIHLLSTQYIAFLEKERGCKQEAYAALLPIQKELHDEALCLLHELAFEMKNYRLVVDLSGRVFQILPTVEVALRCCYAHAHLGEGMQSIRWLETAVEGGLKNLPDVLLADSFDPIRKDPIFIRWVEEHR